MVYRPDWPSHEERKRPSLDSYLMDSFTKWVEAFALRNKEAVTVVKVLVEQVFTRFGTPLSILSDQGKEVDGRIMKYVDFLALRSYELRLISRRRIKWNDSTEQ